MNSQVFSFPSFWFKNVWEMGYFKATRKSRKDESVEIARTYDDVISDNSVREESSSSFKTEDN